MMGPDRWTEKYIRIPFKESGFDRDGCHCWGLVCYAYKKELGIELPKYDNITSEQIRAMLLAKDEQIVSGNWIPVIGPKLRMDVVVMTGDDERHKRVERHVGLYAGNGYILHVERGSDSKCEHEDNPLVKSRVCRAFRYVAK